MHKFLFLMALALAVAVIVPVAALADDPLAAVQADIIQLQTDVKVKHDAVLVDAQTLQTDAQTLVGSDKATAKAKIKADAQKLNTDWHSLRAVCLADRAKLRADIDAAHAAGLKMNQIRPVVREANLQIRASNLEMRAGVLRARAAVIALRQSFKAAGKTAPVVATPPVNP
jgi:hypothetical protein